MQQVKQSDEAALTCERLTELDDTGNGKYALID